MDTLEVRTSTREELVDITAQVGRVVAGSGVKSGICVLWSLHTTAGLTVNESADPDVARDIEDWLQEKAPQSPAFRHREGNSDSHIKTSLMGPGLTLLIDGGRLVLGRWQGVFLTEFDGPRSRRVVVSITPVS
jgi:secondary thiamine-phosphate synthase enzyme